jgi:hypothetical protein
MADGRLQKRIFHPSENLSLIPIFQSQVGHSRAMDNPSDFARWKLEAPTVIDPLFDAVNLFFGFYGQGPGALISISDQLRAVASQVTAWVPANPCPIPDIDGRLVRTAQSCNAIAELLLTESRKADGHDWAAIDLEFAGIGREITDIASIIEANVA